MTAVVPVISVRERLHLGALHRDLDERVLEDAVVAAVLAEVIAHRGDDRDGDAR